MFLDDRLTKLTLHFLQFFSFFTSQITFKPIEVILIYLIIYSSSIFIWSLQKILQDICSIPILWLLKCVYYIHWINVHWYWNLSSGVISNCHLDVSKLDTRIWLPCAFVEDHGEIVGFCYCTCCNKYIDWIQGSS